jgi:DNA-binding beta-propeller fold protein YncE
MRRTRILWPLLAVLLMTGTADAAPGDPYVVYTANSFASGAVILRTDPASGSLVEVSRNGTQGSLFQRPYDLAVEADGSLVVVDLGQPNRKDGAVIRVDPLTGAQSLVSSGGEFYDPAGIAVAPDGQLYVVDNRAPDNDGAVIRVDPRTGVQTLVTQRSDDPGRDQLDLPFGIAVAPDGGLVVANRVSPVRIPPGCQALGRVVRVDLVSGEQQLISADGDIAWPLGLAVHADGSVVVANECGGRGGLIRVELPGGAQSEITSNSGEDVLVTPERIAFDPAGALLVSDFSLGSDEDGGIVRVDPETGNQTLVRAGELFNHPLGIATVVNRPPAAALSLDPPVVAAGRPVRVDASRSSDPEGLRLVYEWDLDGDGSFEAGSGATATASRTFGRHGPATVRVRVNDPHGGRAVAEGGVFVDGAIPVITQLAAGSRVLGIRRRAGAAHRRGRPPSATSIRFNLSEAAAVSATLERARRGRRAADGSCRVRIRRARRCTRWVTARLVSRTGPARHRLLLSAVDAVGNPSARRMLPLRVVRVRR